MENSAAGSIHSASANVCEQQLVGSSCAPALISSRDKCAADNVKYVVTESIVDDDRRCSMDSSHGVSSSSQAYSSPIGAPVSFVPLTRDACVVSNVVSEKSELVCHPRLESRMSPGSPVDLSRSRHRHCVEQGYETLAETSSCAIVEHSGGKPETSFHLHVKDNLQQLKAWIVDDDSSLVQSACETNNVITKAFGVYSLSTFCKVEKFISLMSQAKPHALLIKLFSCPTASGDRRFRQRAWNYVQVINAQLHIKDSLRCSPMLMWKYGVGNRWCSWPNRPVYM